MRESFRGRLRCGCSKWSKSCTSHSKLSSSCSPRRACLDLFVLVDRQTRTERTEWALPAHIRTGRGGGKKRREYNSNAIRAYIHTHMKNYRKKKAEKATQAPTTPKRPNWTRSLARPTDRPTDRPAPPNKAHNTTLFFLSPPHSHNININHNTTTTAAAHTVRTYGRIACENHNKKA